MTEKKKHIGMLVTKQTFWKVNNFAKVLSCAINHLWLIIYFNIWSDIFFPFPNHNETWLKIVVNKNSMNNSENVQFIALIPIYLLIDLCFGIVLNSTFFPQSMIPLIWQQLLLLNINRAALSLCKHEIFNNTVLTGINCSRYNMAIWYGLVVWYLCYLHYLHFQSAYQHKNETTISGLCSI